MTDNLKPREIKFRAWDKQNKSMIQNYAHNGTNGRLYVAEGSEPLGELQLMQFTGLKDKRGKEIYEGDITEFRFDGCIRKTVWFFDEFHGQFRNKLVWWNDVFNTEENAISEEEWIKTMKNSTGSHSDRWTEVMGNIYENHELLEAIDNAK